MNIVPFFLRNERRDENRGFRKKGGVPLEWSFHPARAYARVAPAHPSHACFPRYGTLMSNETNKYKYYN